MGKIIVWIIVIFVILFALRMWNAAKARNRANARKAAPAGGELMVRCERCGTFLPKPEATVTPAGYRCTDPACVRHPSGPR